MRIETIASFTALLASLSVVSLLVAWIHLYHAEFLSWVIEQGAPELIVFLMLVIPFPVAILLLIMFPILLFKGLQK